MSHQLKRTLAAVSVAAAAALAAASPAAAQEPPSPCVPQPNVPSAVSCAISFTADTVEWAQDDVVEWAIRTIRDNTTCIPEEIACSGYTWDEIVELVCGTLGLEDCTIPIAAAGRH